MKLILKNLILVTSILIISIACSKKEITNNYVIDGIKFEKFSQVKDHLIKNSWDHIDSGISNYFKENQKLIVRYAPTGMGFISHVYLVPDNDNLKKQYLSYGSIDSLDSELSKDGWKKFVDGIEVFEKVEQVNKNGKIKHQEKSFVIEYAPKTDMITSLIEYK
jgi:hypothetical protein